MLAVAVILIINPLPAMAGIFSMVNDLFVKSNDKLAEAQVGNSQNMALLEAAAYADPDSSKESNEMQVVDDSAMVADSGPMGTNADMSTDTPTSDQISVYTVHKGDTLAEIAKMFGVTSNTILWANDLKKGTTLKEGQNLVILPISGVRHQVTKGETLDSIAKKYKGDKAEIMSFNGLDSGHLAVGETIIIPDGEVTAPATSGGKKPTAGSASSGSTSAGYYVWPVSGGRKSQGLHGHNGVDIAAPIGTPILASAAGTVIIARDSGWNGGYGSYIVIKHNNGTQTLYGHLSSLNVSVGQTVKKGQKIGGMGSTGNSTGSHVHFEVRGARNPF